MNAKRFKEELNKIKVSLDNIKMNEFRPTNSFLISFRLLVQSELIQRNAIPMEERLLRNNEGNKDRTLAQMIKVIAGKPLVDEKVFPKILLASAAAISGIAAEKCADCILLSRDYSSDGIGVFEMMDLSLRSDEIISRCRIFKENRFQSLISLSLLNLSLLEIVILLLRMSMGNFLRAAYFSLSDQPLMWKRALDVCTKINSLTKSIYDCGKSLRKDSSTQFIPHDNKQYDIYDTIDVIKPLKNLIRISKRKGNHKRVSELSFRLVQGYINNEYHMNENEVRVTSWMSKNAKNMFNIVDEAYINPYNESNTEKKKITEIETVIKAKDILNEILPDYFCKDTNLSHLFKITCLRLELFYEKTVVNIISNARYTAIVNRSSIIKEMASLSVVKYPNKLSNNFNEPSKEEIILRTRRDVLTNSLPCEELKSLTEKYDSETVNITARSLQDYFLLHNHVNESSGIINETCSLLILHIDRLILRAQSIALNFEKNQEEIKNQWTKEKVSDAWNTVSTFIKPILKGSPITNTHIELKEVSYQTLIMFFWMRYDSAKIPIDHLDSVTSWLLETQKYRLEEEKKLMNFQLVETFSTCINTNTKNSSLVKTKLNLEDALWSGKYYIFLSKFDSKKKSLKQITVLIQEATTNFLDKTKTVNPHRQNLERFGTPFLQFLLCWSGLHNVPWKFCNIKEAREIIKYARENLRESQSQWGRRTSSLEEMLLCLSEADAESGQLGNGLVQIAETLYINIIEGIEKLVTNEEENILMEIIRSHCLCGLSRMRLVAHSTKKDKYNLNGMALNDSYLSLNILESLQLKSFVDDIYYEWYNSDSLSMSILYHKRQSQQLVADSFLRTGNPVHARNFLGDAVYDSPTDYDTVFAFGIYCLRMAIYRNDNLFHNHEESMKAQTLLLNAVKLDPSKADPFALLGLWYEVHNDIKRAVGCYSKAILLDPSHAVAGRGILRLRSFEVASKICEDAINVVFPRNGWAWSAIAMAHTQAGDDNLAIICYQEALRCHDIENAPNEILGAFYYLPNHHFSKRVSYFDGNECSTIWCQLAFCHRRLGKLSASLRAYKLAFRASKGHLSNSAVCSWAQVELELGLYDEALRKFEEVLLGYDKLSSFYIAAYGFACSMIAKARRDVEEGKFGMVYSRLEKGVNILLNTLTHKFSHDGKVSPFICVLKLLGDLHSFAAVLPLSAFECVAKISGKSSSDFKVFFVGKGEFYYTHALLMIDESFDIDDNVKQDTIIPSLAYDVGTNLMLQVRIICDICKDGSHFREFQLNIYSKSPLISNLSNRSMEYFLKAIDSNPLLSQAWCGMGCVLRKIDPLLAQHALCRALQIDKSLHEAWANLALIFIEYDKNKNSEEVIDILTQVADTPIMWIARGLLLEKISESETSDRRIISFNCAAESYRAALQVTQHPSAKLGVSLTCRKSSFGAYTSIGGFYVTNICIDSQKESLANLSMYLDSSDSFDYEARMLQGLMLLEEGEIFRLRKKNKFAYLFRQMGLDCFSALEKKFGDKSSNKIISFSLKQNDIKKMDCFSLSELISISDSYADRSSSPLYFSNHRDSSQPNSSFRKSITYIQQEVYNKPFDGEKWLNFAKILIKEWTDGEKSNLFADDIVLNAIRKAKQILLNQLPRGIILKPTKFEQIDYFTPFKHITPSSNIIKSSMLSEALGLYACVEFLQNDVEYLCSETIIDIQKSLILDPESRQTRALLNSLPSG